MIPEMFTLPVPGQLWKIVGTDRVIRIVLYPADEPWNDAWVFAVDEANWATWGLYPLVYFTGDSTFQLVA